MFAHAHSHRHGPDGSVRPRYDGGEDAIHLQEDVCGRSTEVGVKASHVSQLLLGDVCAEVLRLFISCS